MESQIVSLDQLILIYKGNFIGKFALFSHINIVICFFSLFYMKDHVMDLWEMITIQKGRKGSHSMWPDCHEQLSLQLVTGLRL